FPVQNFFTGTQRPFGDPTLDLFQGPLLGRNPLHLGDVFRYRHSHSPLPLYFVLECDILHICPMITNDLDKYDPKGDHLMGWKDFFRLVLLASLWGASFLFIRIAVAPLGPFLLMDLRVLIASGTLMLYAFFLRRLPDLQKRWKEYLLLGTINSAIPFTLIATSELYITSSLAAILNATTPMFTAVVAALWLKDPLTWKKGAGLLLGFIGVAILVGWSPVPMEEKV